MKYKNSEIKFRAVKKLTQEQITDILNHANVETDEEREKLHTALQECVIEYRSTYVKSEDITIIICEGYIPSKNSKKRPIPLFTKISGFYYGEPDIISTQQYCEDPLAVYLFGL